MKKRFLSVLANLTTGAIFFFSGQASAEFLGKMNSHGDEKNITLSEQFNYTAGTKEQTLETELIYTPLNIETASGSRITGTLTLPYTRILRPDPEDDSGIRETWGDVLVNAAYTSPIDENTHLKFSGEVNLPTTEKTQKSGTSHITPAVTLVHMFNIDEKPKVYSYAYMGRGLNDNNKHSLKDVWKASLGAGYILNKTTAIGGSYDFSESSMEGVGNFGMAMVYIGTRLTPDVKAMVYVGKIDITDMPSSTVAGVNVSFKFKGPSFQ